MNKDSIIREWFYRLPNGYATAPYSEKEIDVLHEVLTENGMNGSIFAKEAKLEKEKFTEPDQMRIYKEVDQLDQAFHDAKPIDNTLRLKSEWIWEEDEIEEYTNLHEDEEQPAPTLDELAALLADTDKKYPEKILRRVGELLNVDTLANESVEKVMTQIMGSDANRVDDILDICMRGNTDQTKFATYMQDRSISYTAFMGNSNSLADVFNDTGLSSKAIERLAMYKWPSMPAIGPLEVLLALLLKDGERPTGKQAGDLRVAGRPFEVKGYSARLKGQKGFGSPSGVRKAWISAYNMESQEPNFAPKEESAWGSGSWLITLESLNKKLIPIRGFDSAMKSMQSGFMAAYTNLSASDLTWMDSYVSQDGTIDKGGFIRKLAETAFQYYISVEDIEVFCVTNATLAKGGPSISNAKVLMFKPSEFPKYLGSQIGIVMPSFAESAGAQGVAFGLKLGSKTKALS